VYISAPTVDDLLRRVLEKLVDSNNRIKPSRGAATELTGVLLEITNPRARLSRTETKGKLFSCLGELCWYLAKTNELSFIAHYLSHYREESDDGHTVYGAYGPRLFNMRRNDQIGNVIDLLRRKPTSRQAVIQLFDAADIAKNRKGIPCTCTFQFLIRDRRLHMLTNMRSNDAFLGLSHDIFSFTMLQEIVSRTLSVEIGTYKHAVGSLHLYDRNKQAARRYLEEGWQSTTICMPPMPPGDPWNSIGKVLRAEREIRLNRTVNVHDLGVEDYWTDLVCLLQIYGHYKRHEGRKIEPLRKALFSRVYDTFVDQKKRAAIQ
jgi:thymidylate synthase